MFELTMLRTAHKMLPEATPSSVRPAVRNCANYDSFKKELRTTLRYLEDYGGMKGAAAAHVVEQPQPYREATAYGQATAYGDDQSADDEGEVDVVAATS